MKSVDNYMRNTRPAITGLIKRYAESQPNKTALVVNDHKITYDEFYNRIHTVANFLKSRGVKKGSHVLEIANPDLCYLTCEYAVLGLGAVNIPAESGISVDRLAEIANSVDADFVISADKPDCSAEWISITDILDIEPLHFTDDWNPVCVNNECCEIIFTTGTTGKSKGVMLSSQCLEAYLSAINPTFRLENDSVFLVTTPLNHVGGLHRVHQCMSVGCTVVLLNGIKNLKAFFQSIDEYGVTHTYLPPASVKLLITLAKKNLANLDGKLQFIYTASAPFPTSDIETLIQLLPHTRLHQGYGSSETGSICNCQYNAPGKTINSLGKPYSCVQVVLHDSDGNAISEPYAEGYICSKSDMNMLGYYNEPELTASVLKDGFVYSHDLMFFDEQGELHFAGRGDDVVNIRGFKVAPTEVEDVMLRNHEIIDCACVPYEDNVFGKVLKLFVVMNQDTVFNVEGIREYLEQKLENYKIPKYIECINEIPRTFNGKVDRKRLSSI